MFVTSLSLTLFLSFSGCLYSRNALVAQCIRYKHKILETDGAINERERRSINIDLIEQKVVNIHSEVEIIDHNTTRA